MCVQQRSSLILLKFGQGGHYNLKIFYPVQRDAIVGEKRLLDFCFLLYLNILFSVVDLLWLTPLLRNKSMSV